MTALTVVNTVRAVSKTNRPAPHYGRATILAGLALCGMDPREQRIAVSSLADTAAWVIAADVADATDTIRPPAMAVSL